MRMWREDFEAHLMTAASAILKNMIARIFLIINKDVMIDQLVEEVFCRKNAEYSLFILQLRNRFGDGFQIVISGVY